MKHQLTFYLKTWLFSLSIILLTLIFGFLVFYFSTAFFLEETQKSNFKEDVHKIETTIQNEGVQPEKLDAFIKLGYQILIQDEKQVLYPKYVFEADSLPSDTDNLIMRQQVTDDPLMPPSSDDQNLITVVTTDSKNMLFENKTITYQSKTFHLSVTYPISVTTKDYQAILFRALPIFLAIGLIVSAIVSIIYAKFFSKKIQSINQVIEQMSDLTYEAPEIIQSKDEMQLLENNLTDMYNKLKNTLQQLEAEFHYVQRLEKDRQFFMKGVTHELKTPIMAMSTMIEGMLSNFPEYQDKEKYLQICYKELHSMTKLVNEILETSKLEGLQFQGDTNVAQCLATVSGFYEVLIEDKQLDIVQNVDPQLKLMIPEKYLLKVFSNLMGNAIQYSPAASSILINTDGGKVIVSNSMKEPHQLDPNEIFQPFYSIHSEDDDDDSHGLGLYIVRKILMSYGYQISCHIEETHLTMIIEPQVR
ncbi:sensor histidine kinase [Isobaculum melis]|uniref:histidine kinase n=1 Tax=Isobaculum melis TaxID=142588 RepID=A0A1H9TQW8_9LACT|nr:HAMP domain-containing sensor histidine kinase [Isobaculum melis]SER99575.1 Signal transduction histidine kinase [Isobaculum melis]